MRMRASDLTILLSYACSITASALPAAEPRPTAAEVIVVVGAAGAAEYERQFAGWASHWQTAADKSRALCQVIGQDQSPLADRDRLQKLLKETTQEDERELWLILIGHGTYDRRAAKFNLRGPDVSADDLKAWLAPIKRPLVLIDTSAASAPFLTQLAGPQRVIVTATKSGGEQNFARFGGFLADALVDPAADLDKDEQVSLFEAFLSGSRRTAEWYQDEGRLQTEHALLDDDGDGQGVRADVFDGLEPVAGPKSASPTDGPRAHQRHLVPNAREASLPPEVRRRRDALELQLLELRARKSALPEEEYYERLESILIELARVSRSSTPAAKPQADF